MVKLKRILGTAGRHLATFSIDFRLTTRALPWDRGRPRPPRSPRLNVHSSNLDHVERVVRAARSFAGESATPAGLPRRGPRGARDPREELEWSCTSRRVGSWAWRALWTPSQVNGNRTARRVCLPGSHTRAGSRFEARLARLRSRGLHSLPTDYCLLFFQIRNPKFAIRNLCAFHTSLVGQPVFGGKLLQDD